MITIYFDALRPENIARAADIIRAGGLLGIPTETVYGLGANALDEKAVLHIFEAKGRPQDNPLIIHVPDASWLERYCESVPEAAYRLAERFWPGPLTMILPRKPIVPLRTTGGLETVGVRCPDHPVTLAVIRKADVPIAAPSGNTSGRPSPTCMEDMREDMDGKIDAIFDGGPCRVGVESTIIDLTCTPPRLLRPGGLPLEMLEDVLGEVAVDKAVVSLLKDGEKPKAPGMKYRHYAPRAQMIVFRGERSAVTAKINQMIGEYLDAGKYCPDEIGILAAVESENEYPVGQVVTAGSREKNTVGRYIYGALRQFDELHVKIILAESFYDCVKWEAFMNRLLKAAGQNVIDVS